MTATENAKQTRYIFDARSWIRGAVGRIAARRFDRAHMPERWARRVGVPHDEFEMMKLFIPDSAEMHEYLYAREVGLTAGDVILLWILDCPVWPVADAIWLGLDLGEAHEAACQVGWAFEGYVAARSAGVTTKLALELHSAGVELDIYAAVIAHEGEHRHALEASDVACPAIHYSLCRLVGMIHSEIMAAHVSGCDLKRLYRARVKLDQDPSILRLLTLVDRTR